MSERKYPRRWENQSLAYHIEVREPRARSINVHCDGTESAGACLEHELQGHLDACGGWREVTPFDITKLNTAGVFHEVPKPPKYFFEARNNHLFTSDGYVPRIDGLVEVLRPDIANATIAELREALAKFVNMNPEFSADRDYVWVEGTGAVALDYKGEIAELRARVAELEGLRLTCPHVVLMLDEQKGFAFDIHKLSHIEALGLMSMAEALMNRKLRQCPSEHEAVDAKAEVQA